jgi:hypothetical protein
LKILIGHSGFVGSNLKKTMSFDKLYNSKNVRDAFGLNPDICVYSGVKSEKFLANKFPEEDLEHINDTMENIKKINPKKLILISTIDVFNHTKNVNEDFIIDKNHLSPYGRSRRTLEEWVVKNIKDHHIVRLPALFGENLKKNFVFDMMNPIPTFLSDDLFKRLRKYSEILDISYKKSKNTFYALRQDLNSSEYNELLVLLEEHNFSSLLFTDSRSVFQFYPLNRLASDLELIIEHEITCINLVTEPVNASKLHKFIFGRTFKNEVSDNYPKYNLKTVHSILWGRSDGYLMTSDEVLDDIRSFISISTNAGLL